MAFHPKNLPTFLHKWFCLFVCLASFKDLMRFTHWKNLTFKSNCLILLLLRKEKTQKGNCTNNSPLSPKAVFPSTALDPSQTTCPSVLEKMNFSSRFRLLSLVTLISWPPAFTLLKSRLHIYLILFLNPKELIISLPALTYSQLVLVLTFKAVKLFLWNRIQRWYTIIMTSALLKVVLKQVSNSCYASQKLSSAISLVPLHLHCLFIYFPFLRKTQLEMPTINL